MRRALAAFTTTLVVLGGATAAQAATTRFVAKTGSSDANPCTQASPCLTIARAISIAAGGDTISIGPGTFAEKLVLTKDLTLSGAGAQTFIDANAAATPGVAVDVTDQTVTLANLHIRGGLAPASGGTENAAVTTSAFTAPTVTIVGCTIDQASASSPALVSSPVQFSTGVNLTIESSTITGFTLGVDASGGGTMQIADSSISAPLTNAADDGFAVAIDHIPTTITNSQLTGFIGIDDEDTSLTMTRAVVHAQHFGVLLRDEFSAPAVTVRDSVIGPGATDELDAGVLINGAGASGSVRPTVQLTGDTVFARGDSGAIALDTTVAAADTTVITRNSILRAIDPGAGTNDDDIATAAANPIRWDLGYTSFTKVAGPAIPLPGSGTNIDAVPHFVDDTGADLRLDTTSTLFDKGDPSLVAPGETDVAGNPRAIAYTCNGAVLPDLGAYESGSPIPCPPPGTPPPTTATTATVPPPPPISPPPAPAPAPAPRDTTAPILTHVALADSRFATTAATHHHATVHRRTTLRYTLSETSTVTVEVDLAHHRSHHRATTYSVVGTTTYRNDAKGARSHRFTGRVGKHALHRGDSYRLVITATDAAGNRSSAHHLSFAIVSAHGSH